MVTGGGRQPARWASFPYLLLLLALAANACSPSPPPPTLAPAAATALPAPSPTPLPRSTDVAVRPSVPPSPSPSPVPSASPSPTTVPSATPCAEPGRVISDTFTSLTGGGDHRYRLYLPPCYGADGRTYPSLILMAGNIHDEGKWDELGVDEAADEAIRTEAIPPLLVIMPDGGRLANNTSGGPGSYESLILDELMPHVTANYCAWQDPAGWAIGGLSRGGYWALEIAFRFPERFASAGGHSAALLDQYAGPALNPQQTGLNNDLGDLRVYLDIGSDDYLRQNTIRLHQEMEAAGVAHTWHLNEGRHEDAYWASQVGDYLRWYAEPWPTERDAYPRCD